MKLFWKQLPPLRERQKYVLVCDNYFLLLLWFLLQECFKPLFFRCPTSLLHLPRPQSSGFLPHHQLHPPLSRQQQSRRQLSSSRSTSSPSPNWNRSSSSSHRNSSCHSFRRGQTFLPLRCSSSNRLRRSSSSPRSLPAPAPA